MKHNPIAIMRHEHDIITAALSKINALGNSWLASETEYKNRLTQLITFLRDYADGYHHQKEETILFPELEKHPGFSLHNLTDELNAHHENFRTHIAEIEEALCNRQYEKSFNLLKAYRNDLLDHIAAENEELFVLTENLLNENELENIYFRFQDIDTALDIERKDRLEKSI